MSIVEKHDCFVHTASLESHGSNLAWILNYRKSPLMTLEAAIKCLSSEVSGVEDLAFIAKKKCYKKSIELTLDESAAIYMYTMPKPFSYRLNERLREGDPTQLERWFPFLKLFANAVGKLPSVATTVWRGVSGQIALDFSGCYEQTWWTVNSCSKDLKVIEFYLNGMGTVLAIQGVHCKEISLYSAIPDEKEVILLPGTRVLLNGDPLAIHDRPFIVSLKEYLATGVENAAVVCCFLTPEYGTSDICKLELQYAHKRQKKIIPLLLLKKNEWKASNWLDEIIEKLEPVDFHDICDMNIDLKINELIDRIQQETLATSFHLRELANKPSYIFELMKYEYTQNNRIERFMNPANSFPIEQSFINLALVETKELQEKETRLRDTQHSSVLLGTFEEIYGIKSFIDIKEILDKCQNPTKKLLLLGRAGIGKSTFCRYAAYQWAKGELWSQYQLVAVIPLRCLTEYRYPVGKDYGLYDVLKKECFSLYDLSIKEEELVKDQLSERNVLWLLDGYDEVVGKIPPYLEELLWKLFNGTHHILTSRPYGIDLMYQVKLEIMGFTNENISKYVNQFFDHIKTELKDSAVKARNLHSFLKTAPNIWGIAHIPVNLELICSLWSDQEWSESKAQTMTELYDDIIEWLCRRYLVKQRNMSRAHINNMYKDDIYKICYKELVFLETLAFYGMESGKAILKSKLLAKIFQETQCTPEDRAIMLNIGVLKSFNDKATGKATQTDLDHFFVHLSFQEHFAARYLVQALDTSHPAHQRIIEFIKNEKYNQRFILLFTFASGLLIQSNSNKYINEFWETLCGYPIDLIGFRHMELLISCLDEAQNSDKILYQQEVICFITNWMKYIISKPYFTLREFLKTIMKRCFSIPNNPAIQRELVSIMQTTDQETKHYAISIIEILQITKPEVCFIQLLITLLREQDANAKRIAYGVIQRLSEAAAAIEVIDQLILALNDRDYTQRSNICHALGMVAEKDGSIVVVDALVTAMKDETPSVKSSACNALAKVGELAATETVITNLLKALNDDSPNVRSSACYALGKMGEKVATQEVIIRLMEALNDESFNVRSSACTAFANIGKKAAISDVMSRIVMAIGDRHWCVKSRACDFLMKMSEEALAGEVINRLLIALGDSDLNLRWSACALIERIIEKRATNDVISQLINALKDKNSNVRSSACGTLGKVGEKVATDDLVNLLMLAVDDEDPSVRSNACYALSNMGVKATVNEVINRITIALTDEDAHVRRSACDALGRIGERGSSERIAKELVTALCDTDSGVKRSACDAFAKIGEKGMTNVLINRLIEILDDDNADVRNSACNALGRVSEKAATTNVINRLTIALGDTNHNVRNNARSILQSMGKKKDVSMLIDQLTEALESDNLFVKENVCSVLENIDNYAASESMVIRLLKMLQDVDSNIRSSACRVLGKINDKVSVNEITNQLINALDDPKSNVKSSACSAIGNISKMRVTEKMINRLTDAVIDNDPNVRASACDALGNIIETAATNQIISRLIIALKDPDTNVKISACKALGKVNQAIEKNEITDQLFLALKDDSSFVRSSACDILLDICQKATNHVVITRLLVASAEDDWIRLKVEEKMSRLPSVSFTLKRIYDRNGFDINEILKNIKYSDGKLTASVELLKVFLISGDMFWLTAAIVRSLSEGNAIIVSNYMVTVHGNQGTENIPCGSKVIDELIQGLIEQAGSDGRPLWSTFVVK